jgi:hypothetical protein
VGALLLGSRLGVRHHDEPDRTAIRCDAMELHVDDDGFVRAPAEDCYRVLKHVGAWDTWWPRTRVRELGGDRFAVAVSRTRPLRIEVAAHTWRHDQGFRLTLTGDLTGAAEWWLEPGWGGTVVHHLATFAADRRSAPTFRRYRRWLRSGLWGMKDHLQAEVLDREVAS